jgi:hypothetical protein
VKGRLGRRQFLLAASGGAVVVVGSGAGLGLYSSDYPLRHWIARIIRDNLPGVTISDAALEAYTDDALATASAQKSLTRLAALANLVAPDIHRVSDRLSKPVDDFERYIISGFLLRSNFFELEDPFQDEIVYVGETLCNNPFANFDFEDQSTA